MNDEKPIPAEVLRRVEATLRDVNQSGAGRAWSLAYGVAADYCAREAEKAEAREKCERGEHEVAGNPRGWCVRCSKWIKPEPTDRERLREDVREEITNYDLAVTSGNSVAYQRVRAAELRDFYRRTFGEECP